MWFSCKHPAHRLVVEKEHTVEPIDQDAEKITYHLFCQKCRKPVTIVHANLIGGVDQFLKRASKTWRNYDRQQSEPHAF